MLQLISRSCLVLLVAGSLAACGDAAPDLVPVAELTPLAAWAEVQVVPQRIDLGNDSAEPFLGHGWSPGPQAGHGDAFWAVTSASHLEVPCFEPADLEIRLRGHPMIYEGAPAQGVTLELNGHVLGYFELEQRLQTIRVAAPAELWRRGQNRLVLQHDHTVVPRQIGLSRDRRRLAAAWYEVDFLAPGQETPNTHPTPRAEEGRIFLPWNTGLDFYLRLPPRAALAAEEWTWRGVDELESEGDVDLGSLRVEVQRVGEDSRDVALLHEPPPGPLVLDAKGGLVRLGLRALRPPGGAPAHASGDGILLTSPRILAPAQVMESEGDAEPREQTKAETQTPDALVIFMVDTLRADHLGPWGGDHVETPEIDAFAARSVVFDHLVAQSPWTRASVGSVFTGLWPPAHGAYDREDRLAEGLPTLASLLSDAGWQSVGFVDNPNVAADFGFDRGFELYVEPEQDLHGLEMNAEIGEWLAERDDERPLFLYVHTLEPHSPYNPPDFWRRRVLPDMPAELARDSLQHLEALHSGEIPPDPELVEKLHQLYHAEVSFADHAFGRFLELLDEQGLENAAVLFLSDHGEEFYEHGSLEHGRTLHVESLHVPMILHWPGLAPRRVEEPVQHLDILPTILGRLGLPTPPGLPGDDVLAQRFRGGPPGATERPIFSHVHLDGPQQVSVRQGRWKLIQQLYPSGRALHTHLYDTAADPGETRDVAELHPVRRGWLATLLRREMATSGRVESAAAEIDPELRKSLEALGYL